MGNDYYAVGKDEGDVRREMTWKTCMLCVCACVCCVHEWKQREHWQ